MRASTRRHPLRLDQIGGGRRLQVVDEGLGRFPFLAARRERRGEDDLLLHFGGEWADHVQARRCEDVEEKDSEFHLAVLYDCDFTEYENNFWI